MEKTESILSLIGRILIAFVFLFSGIMKIFKFGWFVKFVQGYGIIHLQPAAMWVVIAMIIEILISLLLIIGLYGRWSALALAVYLAIIIIIYHLNFSDQQHLSTLIYHSAAVGGLLMIFAGGPGKLSLDTLIRKKS